MSYVKVLYHYVFDSLVGPWSRIKRSIESWAVEEVGLEKEREMLWRRVSVMAFVCVENAGVCCWCNSVWWYSYIRIKKVYRIQDFYYESRGWFVVFHRDFWDFERYLRKHENTRTQTKPHSMTSRTLPWISGYVEIGKLNIYSNGYSYSAKFLMLKEDILSVYDKSGRRLEERYLVADGTEIRELHSRPRREIDLISQSGTVWLHLRTQPVEFERWLKLLRCSSRFVRARSFESIISKHLQLQATTKTVSTTTTTRTLDDLTNKLSSIVSTTTSRVVSQDFECDVCMCEKSEGIQLSSCLHIFCTYSTLFATFSFKINTNIKVPIAGIDRSRYPFVRVVRVRSVFEKLLTLVSDMFRHQVPNWLVFVTLAVRKFRLHL